MSTTHTCFCHCYRPLALSDLPRIAFRFLRKSFLVHLQTSSHTAWCVRQESGWLFAGVPRFPGSTEAVPPRLAPLRLPLSLLAAGPRQLRRELQRTPLPTASRCCRLAHPHSNKLTRLRFAQTGTGRAGGKTALVSSSWLIPGGCAADRADVPLSYTALQLCFTSPGTTAVSHPCNYVHCGDPFTFPEDLASYVTYFSSYPVVGDSFSSNILAP